VSKPAATSKLGIFYDAALKSGQASSVENLSFFLENVLRGIDFAGKRVLDVGGGSGLLSFYAATQGANEVICIEPLLEGSSDHAYQQFLAIKERLPNLKVDMVRETFQGFAANKPFDVVLFYNSINHLDENACIQLKKSEEARNAYDRIFGKLSWLCSENALLLICDVSSSNFFSWLGVKNPFFPAIEWQKHQPPELWIEMLRKHAFIKKRLYWRSINPLRQLGKLFLANRVASFFLNSHFCLTLEKVEPSPR
jgi:SAM-dependent methyltransferase